MYKINSLSKFYCQIFVAVVGNYNITVLDLLLHLSHFYTRKSSNVAVN